MSIQCGLLDVRGNPELIDSLLYVDGYSPRLLYVELSAADAQAVRDLPWIGIADETWRATYLPPEDCGPLPEVD